MRHVCTLIAIAAAIAVAAIGFRWGTYAAGGSDSSCYVLMADAFAHGRLQPSSALASQVPWPDATRTFTPGGFLPSTHNPSSFAPICAPGFSVLLAPLLALGGERAMFALSPIAGAALVLLSYVAARTLAGPLAGAMAAALIAVSPPMLYQVVQPMNDVTCAALWMATFVALIHRRWVLAGVFCGLTLLVRPNLLPLALIVLLAVGIRDSGFGIRNVARFGTAAIPFGLLVLGLNNQLYGSVWKTGYGTTNQLFALSNISVNAARYSTWLLETHTPFVLLAFGAPFLLAREKRADAWLALALIVSLCLIYFAYTPFDDWSYLRFLLPAIALMIVLASAVLCSVVSGFSRTAIVLAITAAIAFFCLRVADARLVFNLQALEQRYRTAGIVVRDRLPNGAVVLSVWDSGAVRFHGHKEALSWEALDPAWLDRSLDWLRQNGHRPYLLLESWEEPGFRNRFGTHSDTGKLDWPPKFEIDRVVRIYDPDDRAPFDRGEHVATEYLWPLRK